MHKISVYTALFFIFLFFPLTAVYPQNSKVKSSNSLSTTVMKKSTPLIILDPGHGGTDIGGQAHGIEEKSLTLQTAILVKQRLSQLGYRVILTRSRDLFIPLNKRVAIANGTKSHLLISIHYNAFTGPEVEGVEIYYYNRGPERRRSESKKLAHSVLSCLEKHTGAVSRGVKHGNFHVIREAHMPAILIEGGFITHPKESSRLRDPKYLNQLARAIAEGINQYIHPTKPKC